MGMAVEKTVPTSRSPGANGGSSYRNPEKGAMVVAEGHQIGAVAFGKGYGQVPVT